MNKVIKAKKIPTFEEAWHNLVRVECHTCGRTFTSKDEKEFIIKVGECSSCDHLRVDATNDELVNLIDPRPFPEDW